MCSPDCGSNTQQALCNLYRLSERTKGCRTHYNSTHPLVGKTVKWLIKLKGKTICFFWCAAHVCIIGNERADGAATAAAQSSMPVSNIHVPYRDWYPVIRTRIKQLWQEEWSAIEYNKLRQIKDNVGVWRTDSNHRKNSIVITRLCIGHTRLTHQYLMERGGCSHIVMIVWCHLQSSTLLLSVRLHSDSWDLFYPQTREMSVEETMIEILL